MLSKILSVGNKIELINADSKLWSSIGGIEESKKVYYSQIYDLVDESRIKIGMPIEGGRVVPLGINTKYDACFYTSSGLYQCRLLIVDRYKEGNVFVLVVEPVTELQKYQRRQYYRLGCTMEIKYRVIGEDELEEFYKAKDKNELAKRQPLIEATALDISGGGIRFVSGLKHEKGSEVFLLLEVTYNGQEKIYGLIGKIIAIDKVRNRDKTYEYRVEYRNIEGRVREEIIKFIFEEERKQRQKEKGMEKI